jgi:hypothetical protein
MFVAGCEHRLKLAKEAELLHLERLEVATMRNSSIVTTMNDRCEGERSAGRKLLHKAADWRQDLTCMNHAGINALDAWDEAVNQVRR